MKLLLKISFSILLFISCSSDDDDNNTSSSGISDKNLSGIVFNEPFEAKGGKSWVEDNEIHITITNKGAECESDIFDYVDYISTITTPEVGVYENTNVIFGKKGEIPMNHIGGTVEITEISENKVTVKIKAASNFMDVDNTVEGKFTIPVCE